MKMVYKWQLNTTSRQTLSLQRGAQFLALQVQQNVPCLWCLVDPDQPVEPQAVYIHGTGHPTHPEATADSYIGTYQLNNGGLVFHVFAPGLPSAIAPRRSHEARAEKLREAIRRVVLALEIGPDGEDLAATVRLVIPCMSAAESLEVERGLIDDLVLAVGEVLTKEDA